MRSTGFCGARRLTLIAAAIGYAMAVGSAQAGTVIVSVDSQAGPWDQAVNPTFDYGVHDNSGPTVVGGLTDGEAVTIAYRSGKTGEFGSTLDVDANGYVGDFPSDQPGSSGKNFPGFFTATPANVYLGELVGTFADSTGAIVGTPFAIGDGPLTFNDPTGATQLLLGINDDIYRDNIGGLRISVTADSISAAPEPAAWAMMLIGFCGLGVAMRSRRKLGVATI
jgi:hypothetical protein